MRIILKQDVKGVGKKYEIKNVADGYANNFLIPKRLAEFASPDAIKRAENLKIKTQSETEVKEKELLEKLEILKGVKIILKKKVNEKGHLFEQIHKEEIVTALKEQAKIEIDPEFLSIGKLIKEIGEHTISVQVGSSAQTGKNKKEFQVVIESL